MPCIFRTKKCFKITQYKFKTVANQYEFFNSKIVELEEELRVVGNNLKSLEVSEEKVYFIEIFVLRIIGLLRFYTISSTDNSYSYSKICSLKMKFYEISLVEKV